MTYCSEQQARDAGASGSSAQVTAAIASAEARIDRYTGQRWQAQQMTVAAHVTGKGIVVLPRQIDPGQPVAVRALGATADVPATAYQVTSSRTVGAIDALYLGAGLGDPLVAGAEPWNGGWSNLLPRTGQVLVTATFGTATTPAEVTRAAALLAASITSGGPTDEPQQPTVNDEGETLAVTATSTGAASDTTPLRSTGLAAADALLAPLVRRRVRLSGV